MPCRHRRRTCVLLAVCLLAGLFATEPVRAQGGHGPVFGLATPTLPQGAWNADLTLMSAAQTNRAFMARQTIRYGLTRDVQLNLSVPISIKGTSAPPRTRIGTMMGGIGDVEALALWRVHTEYPGVGQRFESTLLLSGLYPTSSERGGVGVGPGMHAAAVTGYASRTIYAWVGGGYQGYLASDEDRLGNLLYASAVFAWRPPIFQGDYPKPDWRIFVEALAERVARDKVNSQTAPNSGGEKIFVGPTALGLYGAWGLGLGVLFPAYQNLNGTQPEEAMRLAANFSYWF